MADGPGAGHYCRDICESQGEADQPWMLNLIAHFVAKDESWLDSIHTAKDWRQLSVSDDYWEVPPPLWLVEREEEGKKEDEKKKKESEKMKEESKESSDGAASPLEEEEFENKEEKKKRRPRRVRKVCPPLLWIPIGGKDCPPPPK